MNHFSSSPRRNPEDAAAHWASKLDGGSLDGRDRIELDAWLAADARHRVLLSEYCQLSADLEHQLPQLVASGSVAMPNTRGAGRRSWKPFWAAGLLATAAAIALGVWLRSPAIETATVATSVGQRKTITLEDGTRVELNARTSLLVQHDAKERRVRLADGQAFFSVAKDATRPFLVDTPAGTVRVTGTVFDVQTDSTSSFTVTVVEGSVQVSPSPSAAPSSAPVALTANQQLVCSAQSIETRNLDASAVEDALAWRTGHAVFDDTPLSEVLARFGRHHGRAIIVAKEVAHLEVGGRYSLENLDDFLNEIQSFLPVQVSHDSSGAINVTPRTGG